MNNYDSEQTRGRRDSDWADDIATRDEGRTMQNGRRRTSQRRSGQYYDDDDMENIPRKGFLKRHPVLTNFLLIAITGTLLLWVSMWFLDYWTFHGEERIVPDVKGQTYDSAAGSISMSELRAVISDSVFDSYKTPGTVVEQTPIPGANVKKGGNVYLTIVAFSPKLVTVPDFYNVSARQARSMFEGLGIKNIKEREVTSEYSGLVLGAKFNGLTLEPGTRIPVSATITLEVGSGISEYDALASDSLSNEIDNVIDELNIE